MKKNNKGFSLIDVVCATAIIALVALPICSGFLTAAKSNQRIQAKTETYNMLNNELSLILASGEVALDGGITLELDTVECSGENFECKVVDHLGNESDAEISTQGTEFEKKAVSGEWLKITLTPKKALADNTKVAYIDVVIQIYEVYEPGNKVLGEASVLGVWTE